MKCNPLTKKQLDSLSKETDKTRKPVRFLIAGCAIDIETGEMNSKGSYIMYHAVYWDLPKETIGLIKMGLQQNNKGIEVKVTYH